MPRRFRALPVGVQTDRSERYFAKWERHLANPVLGPRLLQCVRLALRIEARPAHDIFGSPDELKFRSCLTLFAQAAPGQSVFDEALRKYFDGVPDARTLQLLGAHRR